ncbi:MAG TPA: TonB-dependent receptor, partial [Thermoanaerobaculia bacterium]|nr:TonB-dependent receptor [Thermoanaerobaculia bacterium]
LNAVTRDPDPGRALRFTLEASDGGQNELRGALAASIPAGAGALLVEGHLADADDAEAGGSEEIFNSSFGAAGGALRYVRPAGPGRLRAALQIERVDDLGKAAIDSREIRSTYPLEDSDRFVLNWLGTPSARWDSLEATLFVGDYRIVLDRDRAPAGSSNRRIDRSDTEARDASLRAVAGHGFAGGRLQLGLDASSRLDLRSLVGRTDYAADDATVVARTTSVAIEEASQVDLGLFATWSRSLAEHWTLAAGARGDRVETENRGGFFGDHTETASALSANLALSWAPAPGWRWTAQIARGFHVPTLSDRYFRGPSGRGFVVGNPELEPETGLQLDLALRRTLGRTSLALYGYRYQIDDLVERYREGDDFHFRNRGEATLEGFELELQARLDERWSLEGGAAWARGSTDGGAPLDDQPAPHLFLGTRYARSWGYAFARLAAHDDKDDPGPTEVERDAYALVDVGGGWRFDDGFELRLTVRNLLDERYSGAADETADRSPGRAILLALSGEL